MSTLTAEPPIKATRRASPSVWPSGTIGARWTSPPRSGATPGKNGPRQSEELPLHRVLDLAILTCRAQLYLREDAYKHPKGYDPEQPLIDRVGLQGDAMSVTVCTENDHIDEDLALFRDALARDGELVGERLAVLGRLVKELGY